jgi:ApaG protein
MGKVMNKDTEHYAIEILVDTEYQPGESDPEQDQYFFTYTITLHNTGQVAAKLLSRHWIITDGAGHSREVRGVGVVGQTPHLEPGASFRYTSGALLETPVGAMYGSYQLMADDGTAFDANIPAFTLAVPHLLH